jgi:DGQHR domain-containing protein
VAEIAEYAKTEDATFPTPILLAISGESYSELDQGCIVLNADCTADIVDGQHRVRGLALSGRSSDFLIPVVFIVDATEEQKALMFATINGKQTKVPASLIYDLFGITESRSPQKTAHEIARALNSMNGSPWFRRLKMLGMKTEGGIETLSQGTFVNQLLPLISSNPVDDMSKIRKGLPPQPYPRCIFNSYFISNKDATILKVLLNFFTAARLTWLREWDFPDESILTKSVGFTGLMQALPRIYQVGVERKDLSIDFFSTFFQKVKVRLETDNKALTNQHFGASASGAGKLRDLLHNVLDEP